MTGVSQRKCLKNVILFNDNILINDREIEALIDSESDFSLMRMNTLNLVPHLYDLARYYLMA